MGRPRWKLSREDLIRYALHGVHQMQGFNAGNPFLMEDEEEEWDRVERELQRRLKILVKQGEKK